MRREINYPVNLDSVQTTNLYKHNQCPYQLKSCYRMDNVPLTPSVLPTCSGVCTLSKIYMSSTRLTLLEILTIMFSRAPLASQQLRNTGTNMFLNGGQKILRDKEGRVN